MTLSTYQATLDEWLYEPYENWDNIRPMILERDEHRCQLCGCTRSFFFINESLNVHHIDHNSRNNNFNNLITLCIYCHKKVHKKTYKDGGIDHRYYFTLKEKASRREYAWRVWL